MPTTITIELDADLGQNDRARLYTTQIIQYALPEVTGSKVTRWDWKPGSIDDHTGTSEEPPPALDITIHLAPVKLTIQNGQEDAETWP